MSISSQSISKVLVGNPNPSLMALATEGEAANKEVPESMMAELKVATYFPSTETPENLSTHQASKATG